jgi:hypothetical protein
MLGDPNAAESRLKAIIDLMRTETVGGERLIDNPVLRDRLMQLQGRVLAMKSNGLRILSAAAERRARRHGRPDRQAAGLRAGPTSSPPSAIDALGRTRRLYDDVSAPALPTAPGRAATCSLLGLDHRRSAPP